MPKPVPQKSSITGDLGQEEYSQVVRVKLSKHARVKLLAVKKKRSLASMLDDVLEVGLKAFKT